MRLRTKGLWVIATPPVVVSLALGYYYGILDWQGQPVCHKQVTGALMAWMMDNGMKAESHIDSFPNAGGFSKNSLDLIANEMGGTMDWAKGYRYIAGLKEDDPGELILMYIDRPTRWTWHGAPPTIFKKKAWLVVTVGFSPSGEGELSERISTEEFKRRLNGTIDFVRTNARPNWQTVVAEHTKFLEGLASGTQ